MTDSEKTACADCGMEIILGAPYFDFAYFNQHGQHVCCVCAEIKYWGINGLPNRYGVSGNGMGEDRHDRKPAE